MNLKPQSRLNEAEAWWAFVARILAFFAGLVIVVYLLIFSNADTVTLIPGLAVGVGMMGQVVISGVAQAMIAIRGKSRDE